MEKNKKAGIIVGVIIVLVLAAVIGVGVFYTNGIKAVGIKENVEFTVEAGDNKIQIVDKLAKAGIIKNKYATLLYVFTHSSKNLQAGNYSLSKNWDAKKIIDTIADGKIINPVKTVKITFVEGQRFNEYAEQIAKTFNMNYDDIIARTSDKEFLQDLTTKYWFITDDVLSDKLYYPLEGYVFPDTYEFFENVSIDYIIYTMLNQMEVKLEPYKEQIQNSNFSAHEYLTMASIIEKEAVVSEDRKMVSQVIYKRLDLNMNLGMDVTSYYGAKKDLKEDLYAADLTDDNPYNTRNEKLIGLPAGAICSPSLDSIDAVFNPSNTDYVYFIADINTGKIYFANSYEEFIQFKNELM